VTASGPEGGDQELPAIDFATFVLSLSHSALVHLGDAPDPSGGPAKRDVAMAKQTIDLLAVLRADDVADRGSVGQRGELSDDQHERCTGSSERSWSTHSQDPAIDASRLHLHAAPAR